MTTLREAAQQALEALEHHGGNLPWNAFVEVRKDLRAALAQQAEPETCTWYQDGDSDSGVYATSCWHYFNLEDGTPEDNKMAWCCYCGKKLAQSLITEDEDDHPTNRRPAGAGGVDAICAGKLDTGPCGAGRSGNGMP